MTIDELIHRLQVYRSELGGDCEVRLMTQPTDPFENGLHGLISGFEINGREGDSPDNDVAEDRMLYLLEGNRISYGSRRAWYRAF